MIPNMLLVWRTWADSRTYIFFIFFINPKRPVCVSSLIRERVKRVYFPCAPHRPNKLDMSLVRLDRIEENILYIRDVDILDGTPLLDIKPYMQRFDRRENVCSGWQEEVSDNDAKERGRRGYNG